MGIGETENAVKPLAIDHDPNSCSNFSECRIKHMKLDWIVDLEHAVIQGSVVHKVVFLKESHHVFLDCKDLVIVNVTDDETGKSLHYTLCSYGIEAYGMQLKIRLHATKPGHLSKIRIDYTTTKKCTALQFLKPEQTAEKKLPYMFSQGQPIYIRTLVPCMDTPAVKQTYEANVSVKSPLVALMGALSRGSPVEDTNIQGNLVYSFEQKVPIPSYLIAIVVGNLVKRDISDRCAVWSEPSLIDACQYEFAEMEIYLEALIDLLGEYVWGRYDILVLPPSAPFAGMEHPCLTYSSPTLLTGDRSLSGLLMGHEMAHSWTGNLVTNATFEHYWLNEGHTNFIERKISGRIMKSEAFRHLEAVNAWKFMDYAVNTQLGPDNQLTKLVPNLTGADPETAFSTVPYEKGHALLFTLENLLGGAEKFDPFLRSYIDKFKYQSITTNQWKEYLYEFFNDKHDVLDFVAWKMWLHTPGMPPMPE